MLSVQRYFTTITSAGAIKNVSLEPQSAGQKSIDIDEQSLCHDLGRETEALFCMTTCQVRTAPNLRLPELFSTDYARITAKHKGVMYA
jgi:hypothetical protein